MTNWFSLQSALVFRAPRIFFSVSDEKVTETSGWERGWSGYVKIITSARPSDPTKRIFSSATQFINYSMRAKQKGKQNIKLYARNDGRRTRRRSSLWSVLPIAFRLQHEDPHGIWNRWTRTTSKAINFNRQQTSAIINYKISRSVREKRERSEHIDSWGFSSAMP